MNIEHESTAARSGNVDSAFAQYLWMRAHSDEPVTRSKGGKVAAFWILCVCSWSMFETCFEIGTAHDNLQLCALLVAKLVWLLVGGATILDNRAGRVIFAFLCGVSILAVAPALPSEYVISKPISVVLLVECLLKTACLISFGSECRGRLRDTEINNG